MAISAVCAMYDNIIVVHFEMPKGTLNRCNSYKLKLFASCTDRYEEEINRRTSAENEFVMLKKVRLRAPKVDDQLG